ncbi:MAG: amidohydrolase family protein [Ignavibacteriaceae bacterium]|nr:amidohydrolase family protein [Ignavibacteriaceae bacterium]
MTEVLHPGVIVTCNSSFDILTGHAVVVEGTYIKEIIPSGRAEAVYAEARHIYKPDMVMTPGFIQTHIHLCQTLFRGLADDLELLDWLQLRIFPYENAHSASSLRASVRLGIDELLRGGTTTLLDMGTLRHTEVIFDELASSGIRAFAGKCMIDENDLFPGFKGNTGDELRESYDLAKAFHNTSGGRVNYGFAPRFVLSCSDRLLRETAEMVKDIPGALIHTHSSENKKEVEEVRKKTGKENIDYFNSIGMLEQKTVLAHCIHIHDGEVKTMAEKGTSVAHCPSSNLKLASGIANIPHLIKSGVNVSLGADGAPCNNRLSVFREMNLAALIQKPIHGPTSMNAREVMKLATINGAKALGIEHLTGSIELGKKADLVLLNLNKNGFAAKDDPELVCSKIVYSAGQEDVDTVIADGRILVEGGVSRVYDAGEVFSHGKRELNTLLGRL